MSAQFTVVGQTSTDVPNNMAFSSDGVSWTASTISGANWELDDVCVNSAGLWVAIGLDASQVNEISLTSTDGINWFSHTMSAPILALNATWVGVCPTSYGFAAVGYDTP